MDKNIQNNINELLNERNALLIALNNVQSSNGNISSTTNNDKTMYGQKIEYPSLSNDFSIEGKVYKFIN